MRSDSFISVGMELGLAVPIQLGLAMYVTAFLSLKSVCTNHITSIYINKCGACLCRYDTTHLVGDMEMLSNFPTH